MSNWLRFVRALALLFTVLVIGTVGYLGFGFGFVDALYQTITTVSTVGFQEVQPLDTGGKIFTMALILLGVAATLYAFTVLIETLIEGRLLDLLGRRRMERAISTMNDHVIVCGWGRVGQSIAAEVSESSRSLVVVDTNEERLLSCPHPSVIGDATRDAVLNQAGIARASALVAAAEADATNSFITLSARSLRPDLFLVARARGTDSEEKLRRVGADRVVNPQQIGGARMAAFVLRPHVAEFLDVVMHEASLEFRLEELTIAAGSPIAGKTLRDAHIRANTGALVLAMREPAGALLTNPSPDIELTEGQLLIAIGTSQELKALADLVRA